MMDHDLTIDEAREGGFVAGLDANYSDVDRFGATVTLGTLDKPLLNLLGSCVVGAVGAALYLLLTCLPNFDAGQAVIDKYELHCEQTVAAGKTVESKPTEQPAPV
jgi:hypothetical protein